MDGGGGVGGVGRGCGGGGGCGGWWWWQADEMGTVILDYINVIMAKRQSSAPVPAAVASK